MIIPQQEGLVLPILAVPPHPFLDLIGEACSHQGIGVLVEGAVFHFPVACLTVFGIPHHGGPVRNAAVGMTAASVVLPSILQY